MEIAIKKIGKANGTIGWLAAGLQSGDLYFAEGHAKNGGNHGLWLYSKDGKISQCVALFNQYDLTAAEYAHALRYDVIEPERRHLHTATEACWRALLDIAQQWCDTCNQSTEAEQLPTLRVVRTEEVAHA